jgi:hypothetical protein
VAPPPGCKFAPRCPYAQPRCEVEEPPLEYAGLGGHRFACHYPLGTAENAKALEANLDRGLPQALAMLDAEGDGSVDLASVLAADDSTRRGPTTVATTTDTTDREPPPSGAADRTGPTPG